MNLIFFIYISFIFTKLLCPDLEYKIKVNMKETDMQFGD